MPARGARSKGTAPRRREAERRLRAAAVRPTAQRVDVAAALMEEPDDVTAQELHARLDRRAGLATVYRTLSLLTEAGLVDTIAHRRGELCYRWCGDEHHHHLVCLRCHRVVELAECDVGPWLDRVSAAHGFVATAHRLEAVGVCGECRAA